MLPAFGALPRTPGPRLMDEESTTMAYNNGPLRYNAFRFGVAGSLRQYGETALISDRDLDISDGTYIGIGPADCLNAVTTPTILWP